MTFSPPDPNQLEISVFGPGIGECVVVHIGDGDWVVVDSCIDKSSKQPIALSYLNALGVDVPSRVKLVVSTHWHDDHIRGIGEIFEQAKKAKFVQSAAYSIQELARLAKLGAHMSGAGSVTTEYERILTELLRRRSSGERVDAVGPMQAVANRKLLSISTSHSTVKSEVYALSPADGVLNRGLQEIRSAIATLQDRRIPAPMGANQLSVVLWLKIGIQDVLLGADLEYVTGSTEGWKAIVGSQERPEGKAAFFKVPHHGSKNAYSSESWDTLIAANCHSVITPYSPSKLPRPADVFRLIGKTAHVYLTNEPAQFATPRRENAVEKTLREVVDNRRALSGQMGHVRFRCDALLPGNTTVHLEHGAKKCS